MKPLSILLCIRLSVRYPVKPVMWLFLLFLPLYVAGQQVQLENLKDQFTRDKFFRINGGLSANGVYYNGNNPNRDPLTWILSGNVNMSFFNQLNLPFAFNFNNLGSNYSYPTMPNRLSIHPTYKWIAGHIGDVSMTFSPYTLNGHLFTGAGLELTPTFVPLQVSVMYGRLLKATPFNPEAPQAGIAYKRMGYGTKVRYEHTKFAIGASWFGAGDNPNSLPSMPDSIDIFPQSNQAFSGELALKLINNLVLQVEYGLSMLTRDARMPASGDSFFDRLVNKRESTGAYQAIKTGVTYQLMKNTFGFGYERVDPEYQTLGAYYFNNDLENFTLSYGRPFLENKISMSLNAGIQRDNLNNNKDSDTKRFVGSAGITITPNDKINISASYSGFQTYTNLRSQFDYINEITEYDNLDTLDFTQLSQNANANVTYRFGTNEARKHNLNLNVSYQEAADKNGGVLRTGGLSQYYNMALAYGLLFVPQNLQLTASANVTYNTTGQQKAVTYGPVLGITSKLFDKKVTTGASVSYNISDNKSGNNTQVINLRWSTSYTFLKSHNLSLVLINQNRKVVTQNSTQDFTTTLTYRYQF